MIKMRQQFTLTYPENTLIHPSDPMYRKRLVYAQRVRDLMHEPLSIDEYLNRPMVARGRYLLLAKDIERNQWRQFYLANSLEFATESMLRIGIYDRPGKPIDVRPTSYSNENSDRVRLAKTLLKHRDIERDGVKIGVFAEDIKHYPELKKCSSIP